LSRSRRWIGCVVAAACLAGHLHAQAPAAAEEDIKAAFLFNFAKYVTWPPKSFPDGKFRICVMGDAAFARKIDATIEGETLDGRAVIRPPAPAMPDIARGCHILFIAASESSRTAELLAAVRGSAVLTVGETEAFSARGGMVTFVRDADRVRFDINASEAERVGLTVSSRLLRLARRVISGGDRVR
jgi:hypothetical protein